MRLTLLFTDVEGSTRLLRESPGRYAELLAGHRGLLRAAFRAHGGTEVDTQGDAFFVAFGSASDAVAAAAEAQGALAGGPIRVRMGIHTGEAERTSEGYVGLAVHKGARIAAAAHGGQVVLSRETWELLGSPDVLDLGEHRLKDFDEPIWLFQLGREGFPPLRTISNTNLPRPASSFVGRESEVAALVALLRDGARLVTLSGPGGSGKSRLAIEAAAELVPEFRNGVFWVGLAPVRDPALVPEVIARTVGTRDALAAHIAERELLLVLDNLEQVIDSASALADLLERCPNLRVLVTSRELLRVRGEVEYPVAPMAAPEAVELFATRGHVEPSEVVAKLCMALDNLPLAIELAAARTRVLSPMQIVERLSERLDLLKGGRDAQPRHQTLRATIEWSYELLAPEERRLFACLSVFAGGCTLDAAGVIVQADVDTMQALVEKSLLRHSDERFWMLETIREYAVERLEEGSGGENWESRHARFFLDFGERVEPELAGPEQAVWLDLTERDHPNLRLALSHFADASEWQSGLRLAAALRPFWFRKGYLGEGRRWLTLFLDAADEQTVARAKALGTAALLAALQGDWLDARRWGTEGRRLSLELGQHRYACRSMLPLGRALLGLGDRAGAVALFEEVAAIGQQNDDHEAIAHAAFNLGYAALSADNLEQARAEFEVALANAGEEQDAVQTGVNITARSLAALGSVALRDGRPADSAALLRRSLRVSTALRERDDTVAWALELLGAALSSSEPERAARVLGAAEALREELGGRLEGIEFELHGRTRDELASALGEDALVEAWGQGHRLPFADAVREALVDESTRQAGS